MLRVGVILKQKGVSQRKLSRDTGINVSTVNAMVNGQRTWLSAIEEEKIAKVLGVDPKELYQGGYRL